MNKQHERLDMSNIDILEVALSLGYKIKEKNLNTALLLKDEKEIFVYLHKNQFCNQHDNRERGDAAQLIINEKYSNLEFKKAFVEAKIHIKNLTGIYDEGYVTPEYKPKEQKPQVDPLHFLNLLQSKRGAHECQYLLNDRCLSKETLQDSELSAFGTDTALFFHQNISGEICGYEYRKCREPRYDKDRVKGFSYGGKQGLFSCNYGDIQSTEKLIIVESAINALSLVDILKIHNKQCTALIVSTGGNLSNYQLTMIIDQAKQFDEIYIAMDNDPEDENGKKRIKGEKHAYKIAETLSRAGIKNYERMRPNVKDWNKKLQLMKGKKHAQ